MMRADRVLSPVHRALPDFNVALQVFGAACGLLSFWFISNRDAFGYVLALASNASLLIAYTRMRLPVLVALSLGYLAIGVHGLLAWTS